MKGNFLRNFIFSASATLLTVLLSSSLMAQQEDWSQVIEERRERNRAHFESERHNIERQIQEMEKDKERKMASLQMKMKDLEEHFAVLIKDRMDVEKILERESDYYEAIRAIEDFAYKEKKQELENYFEERKAALMKEWDEIFARLHEKQKVNEENMLLALASFKEGLGRLNEKLQRDFEVYLSQKLSQKEYLSYLREMNSLRLDPKMQYLIPFERNKLALVGAGVSSRNRDNHFKHYRELDDQRVKQAARHRLYFDIYLDQNNFLKDENNIFLDTFNQRLRELASEFSAKLRSIEEPLEKLKKEIQSFSERRQDTVRGLSYQIVGLERSLDTQSGELVKSAQRESEEDGRRLEQLRESAAKVETQYAKVEHELDRMSEKFIIQQLFGNRGMIEDLARAVHEDLQQGRPDCSVLGRFSGTNGISINWIFDFDSDRPGLYIELVEEAKGDKAKKWQLEIPYHDLKAALESPDDFSRKDSESKRELSATKVFNFHGNKRLVKIKDKGDEDGEKVKMKISIINGEFHSITLERTRSRPGILKALGNRTEERYKIRNPSLLEGGVEVRGESLKSEVRVKSREGIKLILDLIDRLKDYQQTKNYPQIIRTAGKVICDPQFGLDALKDIGLECQGRK